LQLQSLAGKLHIINM